MKNIVASSTHNCPYCQKNIHGICGVSNPKGDSGITYSQICFSCAEKEAEHNLDDSPAVVDTPTDPDFEDLPDLVDAQADPDLENWVLVT